jgi:hypothetical protein
VQGGGGVSARSRKCGGGTAFDLGWLGTILDRDLCLLITMSRMGYLRICLDGKCIYV